jgi:hypothetical protein
MSFEWPLVPEALASPEDSVHRALVRFVVATSLVTGASLAFAFSTGPPASRTGAPSVGGVVLESVCTACHTGFALNTAGATLQILDVPTQYDPDAVYTLRVRMTSTFALPRRWGFQITAVREADGQGVGTFDIGASNELQIVAGSGAHASRRYVEHTAPGTFDNNSGPVEWSFNWQAPSSDLGRIFFFAAGNAANSSGTNAGDHIYTARDTTVFNSQVDVPPSPLAGLDVLESPRPNPFRGLTAFSYSLAESGPVDLSVFDLQGRRTRTLVSGQQPSGPASVTWDGSRDDGTHAAAGVYFARLVAPGSSKVISRKVVLAR